MKSNVTVKLATLLLVIVLLFLPAAELLANPGKGKPVKPFRLLTSGKLVTFKSKTNFERLMVWSSAGHRIVELKGEKNKECSFQVPSKEKVVYVMIQYSATEVYTEKVSVKN